MAAKAKKEDKKKEKRIRFSFFSDMDPVKKSNILKYTGVRTLSALAAILIAPSAAANDS